MIDEDYATETAAEPRGVGPQLRAARERMGLTLHQLAKETRISRHHLDNIERGNFADLPARAYALGFARTYAKTVGLDQQDVAAMVDAELALQQPRERSRKQSFEPGDPARVPSARLGLISIVALVLLLAGLFFAARLLFAPAAELPSLVEQQEAERAAALAAEGEAGQAGEGPQAAQGPVVFTALEEGIWVKFYDGSGAQLMQKLMAEGETYTVPEDADSPQLWTGRPDALAISVGGREIPRLSEKHMIMRDVPVTAESLLARAEQADGVAAPGSGEAAPVT